MKMKIFYIAVLLLVASGCKDYLDVNENPNAPTTGKPELVLSGAIIESARIQTQDMTRAAGQWVGYLAASGSYSQSGDVFRSYNLRTNTFSGNWAALYSNANNYVYVENASKKLANYEYYVAISKIMKAYCMHTLVDLFGNVPYTSGFKGFGSLSPAYDDGQAIYENLSVQLDSAVIIINNAQASIVKPVPVTGATDVMFGGKMDMWKKLANTIRLRILLRQSEVSGKVPYIQAEMAKIVANGAGFLGSGENALVNPGYKNVDGQQSPLWALMGFAVDGSVSGKDYLRSSKYSLKFFKNNSDPRMDYVFRTVGADPGKNDKTTYAGIDFGALPDTDIGSSKTSAAGIGILSAPDQDAVFLSAAESLFLQAEAIQRGWLAGDAQTTYETAVYESFDLLDGSDDLLVDGTDVDDYLSNGKVNCDWAASPDKIQTIIVQKWAAMHTINCMEAWCDLRRLGFPVDVPISIDPAVISNKAPIRVLYPVTEYTYNAAEVAKQGDISQFTSKIFWEK
jgi:hypothetical protein